VAPGQLLRQRCNNLLAIFRSLRVEHIPPNPLANLPIEQGAAELMARAVAARACSFCGLLIS